jgi:hypothetical protein
MGKVTLVALAGTRTEAGTRAAALFSERSPTIAPSAGAAASSVTVPVEGSPPMTVVGETDTLDTAALVLLAVTVRIPRASYWNENGAVPASRLRGL